MGNNTGHAETVKVVYDTQLHHHSSCWTASSKVVDPTSVNKQGRSGKPVSFRYHYVDEEDRDIAEKVLAEQEKGMMFL